MRRAAAAEPVKDLSRRLEIRQTGFQAHWLGLVRRAERRYNEAETGGLENNAGIIEGGYFMYSNNSNGSRAAPAQGFAALWAVLALGLGALASPAAAAPFAYVTNAFYPGTVSVIDTATNTVVVTLAVGYDPIAVAVTPDGKHAYVTNMISNTVSVIRTASNTVVATVPVNYSRAIVEWPIEPYDPFFNANDSSDLTAAETILARRDNHLA
jgi:YVTN family beta-propeller protein